MSSQKKQQAIQLPGPRFDSAVSLKLHLAARREQRGSNWANGHVISVAADLVVAIHLAFVLYVLLGGFSP
jgi:hypothetical protein